jgi:hypothetical protein
LNNFDNLKPSVGIDEVSHNMYNELEEKFKNALVNKDGYDPLKWQQDYLASIKQVDERYDIAGVKTEIAKQSDTLTFYRLMRLMDGVRFTHKVEVNGQVIPMRLITIGEEEQLLRECIQQITNDPIESKIPGQFEKVFLIKKLSLASSVFMDNGKSCEINKLAPIEQKQYRFFSENDIKNLTQMEFAKLAEAYNNIELEYNTDPSNVSDEEVANFIGNLLDEKKTPMAMWELLMSSDLHKLRKTSIKLCEIIRKHEDNIRLGQLLEDTTTQE